LRSTFSLTCPSTSSSTISTWLAAPHNFSVKAAAIAGSNRTSMLAHRTDKKQRKKERREKRNSEKAPSAVHFARTNLWELQNANILSSLFYDSGPN